MAVRYSLQGFAGLVFGIKKVLIGGIWFWEYKRWSVIYSLAVSDTSKKLHATNDEGGSVGRSCNCLIRTDWHPAAMLL